MGIAKEMNKTENPKKYIENERKTRNGRMYLAIHGTQSQTAQQQIESADIIILNKIDLVSKDHLFELESILKMIRSRKNTPIIHCQYGKIPIEMILGIEFNYDLSISCNQDISSIKKHPNHLVQDGFFNFAYKSQAPFAMDKFEYFFSGQNTSLGHLDERIIRAKGIVWVHGFPCSFVFQLSGRRTNPLETRDHILKSNFFKKKIEYGFSQIVFIAINIDQSVVIQKKLIEDTVANKATS